MKKMRSILAILLAGTMVAGLATGCGKDAGSSDNGSEGNNDAVAGTETGDAATGESTANGDTPLVIACADLSEKFSEFFANSVPDQNVADLTAVALLGNDRAGEIIYNGIEGETKAYNGTDYTYYGIADCSVTENEDGTVSYEFQLRDDVKFSDGEILDADDVIFSYYVFCDPTYDGGASVYALPIKGLEAYRSGTSTLAVLLADAGRDNTDFTFWTEEQQTAFWAAIDEGGTAFAQEIVDYCVTNGYNEEGDVAGAAANWNYPGLADDATATDFFMAIGAAYGWNFEAMEAETAGSALADLLPADVLAMATTGIETGDSVDYIEGIEKTGDFSVKITLDSIDATAIYQLAIPVQPLHYYGDASAYDYDAHNFGFPKGDLSSVRAKTTEPMGAGPYKFVKYENKTVYMEANENYYKGAPVTKNLQYKVTSEADMVPAVVQGTVDISEPSASKEALANMASENSNGETNGDVLAVTLTDYKGYGYIGMNSQNIKVGDDPSSEQSKDLRKAIATVIAVYRDVTIDSYYGEAASVINYPISNTSWAAPQKSDADYEVAFSKDVDGNPIYTDGMSEEDKYAAALQAALGYFEAAGYTVTDGQVTAAPAGAKMSYELMIGGGGTGDHPSMGVVTAASEALASIGFELKINDLSDSSVLWAATEGGTAEIWCAAWSTTLDPDMFQIYHSEGGSAYMYCIYSDELDKMVTDARTNTDQAYRKAKYKECLDFIVDYAVEIPIYQRQECSLYSTQRVNMDTVCPDQTTYYGFLSEIQTLQMN